MSQAGHVAPEAQGVTSTASRLAEMSCPVLSRAMAPHPCSRLSYARQALLCRTGTAMHSRHCYVEQVQLCGTGTAMQSRLVETRQEGSPLATCAVSRSRSRLPRSFLLEHASGPDKLWVYV